MPSKPMTAQQAASSVKQLSKPVLKGKARPRKGPTARKTEFGKASPPPPKPPGTPGPEGWKPTAANLRKIENLVVLGMDDVVIARYFHIHVDTLRKHAQHILDHAVMTVGMEAVSNLRDLGEKGDKPNYYMLGNRFSKQWRDTRHVEVHNDEVRPDLSRATPEQLEVLREAALVMQKLKTPALMIDHEPEQEDEDDER
jgi:hypothetical protein